MQVLVINGLNCLSHVPYAVPSACRSLLPLIANRSWLFSFSFLSSISKLVSIDRLLSLFVFSHRYQLLRLSYQHVILAYYLSRSSPYPSGSPSAYCNHRETCSQSCYSGNGRITQRRCTFLPQRAPCTSNKDCHSRSTKPEGDSRLGPCI